jgi:CRP/FNR family transcriptional regulator
LFRQGFRVGHIHLLEAGVVKFVRLEEDGREMILDLRSPVKLLGAFSLLSDNLAPWSAVTLTKCEVQSLAASTFLGLIDEQGQLARHLLHLVSQQAYEQVINHSLLGTIAARSRLARLLLKFAPSELANGLGEVRLELPLKQHEIASLLAIRPEYLNRLLKELENGGVIKRKQGWLLILSRERLEREVGGK